MTEIRRFGSSSAFVQSQMYVYATGQMSNADICGVCFHFLGRGMRVLQHCGNKMAFKLGSFALLTRLQQQFDYQMF